MLPEEQTLPHTLAVYTWDGDKKTKKTHSVLPVASFSEFLTKHFAGRENLRGFDFGAA